MILQIFFSFVFFQSALAAFSSKQCQYNQGILSFCRDIDATNFSSSNPRILQFDAQSIPKALHLEGNKEKQSDAPAWLNSFPFNFFQAIQSKNNTWTLRLPIHTRKIYLSRLNENRLLDPILMDESDLDQRRVIIKPKLDVLPKLSNCDFEANQANFALLINVTDQKIQEDSWYVLCAEFNAVEESLNRKRQSQDNSSGCSRCTLLKPSAQGQQLQFLQYSWLRGQGTGNGKGGILQYTIADMPFQSAKLIGSVIDLANQNMTAFDFNRPIKPKQQIFIRVPQWQENGSYLVKTDVYPDGDDGKPFNIDNIRLPLVLNDYLREESSI